MTNEAPSSRRAAKFLAIGAVVLGIALGLFGTFAIPRFRDVFEAFGTYLPWQTKLLIDFPYLLWTPLVLSLVLWWLLRSDKARVVGYIIILLCEFVSIPLIVTSMYLPIFNLARMG